MTRGPDKAPRAEWREASAETMQAWIEHRQILVDELVQHVDVWEYIAAQAEQLAREFPEGSQPWRTMLRLVTVARDVAGLLVEAADAEQRAAS